jgi:hypothetical protein
MADPGLGFMGRLLIEDRPGLVAGARLIGAGDTAERTAALHLVAALPGWHRITVAADIAQGDANSVTGSCSIRPRSAHR